MTARGKINNHLEQIAQAIFKEMFIKKEGDRISLLNFCKFIKGKKPAILIDNYQNRSEPYLTIDSLTGTQKTYTVSKNSLIAHTRDILMVMDGASSGTVYFGKRGIVGSTLAKITVSNLSMQEIIYQTLKYFENNIKDHITGSAIPHVDKQYVLQLSICVPDDYQRYSIYFEIIRNLLIENRDQNIYLSALRDALLPRLMSGEIDVSHLKTD